MKIALFGGTGSVGRHLVPKLLEQGHEVAFLTRHPDNIPQGWQVARTFQGDVTDIGAVRETLAAADLVYCLLGAPLRDKRRIRTRGTAVIVDAMRAERISRIICLSSFGAGASYFAMPRLYRWLVAPLMLRSMLNDHNGQENILRRSGLDWTLVRPGNLTDAPHADFVYGDLETVADHKLSLKVSRADLSDFLVQCLTDPAFGKRSLWVSS